MENLMRSQRSEKERAGRLQGRLRVSSGLEWSCIAASLLQTRNMVQSCSCLKQDEAHCQAPHPLSTVPQHKPHSHTCGTQDPSSLSPSFHPDEHEWTHAHLPKPRSFPPCTLCPPFLFVFQYREDPREPWGA